MQSSSSSIATDMRTAFSKLLTQNDVESALSISSPSFDSQSYQEGDMFYMHVIVDGAVRVFPCTIHRISDGKAAIGTSSSVLSITWPEFVREKGVRADDMVVFREKLGPATAGYHGPGTVLLFEVEVKRKLRLFGQDIWAGL